MFQNRTYSSKMTKSDLIVSLVRAGAAGDKGMLRSTVEAMMADERAKSHHILADRLGVPVAQHPLLVGTIVLDDQFGLVPQTQVADHVHGTAMASLILRGDRNLNEQAIARRIHLCPRTWTA